MKKIIFLVVVFSMPLFSEAESLTVKTFLPGSAKDSVTLRAKVKVYSVRATVKKIYRTEKKIMLDHEKIEGYMNAMVMTFPVSDTTIFEKVQAGSKGIFTLRVENGFPAVTAVKKAEAAKALYRCPMHPKETSDKPGKCPICGMDYERVN